MDRIDQSAISRVICTCVFFGVWAFAILSQGWFLGVALGWLPAAILAYIAFLITLFLGDWLSLVLIVGGVYTLYDWAFMIS